MINLITGAPGDGKTLYALAYVKAMAEREGRQVFYSGIADLRLPWTEVQAEDWYKCPTGAIIVIDECQRLIRPRSYGSAVPAYVSEFETHRHSGHDVFLITQHPMLIDVSVRRLAKLHFHCVRKFGFAASTVHEFADGVRDAPEKNRSGSIRHDFIFPKAAYGWYKSAEVHTHKVRIPARVYVLVLLPVVLAMLAWYAWRSLGARLSPGDVPLPSAHAYAPESSSTSRAVATRVSTGEYVATFDARVPGLAYTAPAYDKVTDIAVAPYPAACVFIRRDCRCWSQQATRLDVPQDLCKRIVDGGFFVAWDAEGKRVERRPVVQSAPAPAALPAPPAPSMVVINGGGLGGTPSTSPRQSGQPAAAMAAAAP